MDNVLITLNPKAAQKEVSKKVREFQNTVNEAGYFELEREEVQELKALDVVPPDFQGPELPSAMHLYAKGADGEKLSNTVSKLAFLKEGERQFLQRTAYLLESFKEANVRQFPTFEEVYAANQEPEITISEVPQDYSPGPNDLLFSRFEGVFRPIFKEGVGRAANLAKDKLKDFAIKAIKKGGKELIKKGADVAIKAGLKAAEAIGAAIPGVDVAVLAKNLFSLIKKGVSFLQRGVAKLLGERDTRRAMFSLSLVLTAGGLFAGSGLLTSVGIIGMTTSGISIVGGKAVAGGIKGTFQTLTYGIATATTPYVAPLLAVLIIIPFIFAIIIFIINSGAYVVPPTAFQTQQLANPYIRVEKVADPDIVDNPPPDRTINYTITVTALTGTLTNITFTYECGVFGDGEGTPCPSVTIPDAPSAISPGSPFSFTYPLTYGSQFSDSVVVDTFTVNADAPEAPNQEVSTSASVIIGEPPSECLIVSDNALPWGQFRGNAEGAVARLGTQHNTFVTKVCASSAWPIVNLCYNPPAVSYWGWHIHSQSCDVYFSGSGFTNINNATFIIAHEIAHHLDAINGQWFQAYLDSGAPSEGPICSYIAGYSLSEGFAEGIGLYAQLPTYWGSYCSGTYQQLYPLHYQFAEDVIY